MGLHDGSLDVRRSILIHATATRVWQEFETFERMQTWPNLRHVLHRFEVRVGGIVEMSV